MQDEDVPQSVTDSWGQGLSWQVAIPLGMIVAVGEFGHWMRWW